MSRELKNYLIIVIETTLLTIDKIHSNDDIKILLTEIEKCKQVI